HHKQLYFHTLIFYFLVLDQYSINFSNGFSFFHYLVQHSQVFYNPFQKQLHFQSVFFQFSSSASLTNSFHQSALQHFSILFSVSLQAQLPLSHSAPIIHCAFLTHHVRVASCHV